MSGSPKPYRGGRAAVRNTLLFCCAGLLLACDGTPDRLSGTPRDSAGVTIVAADGVDRPLDWRFSTVWSMGLDDDDPVLFDALGAHQVAVGPDRRVYALDVAGQRVLVLDAAGVQVGTLGRGARGAAELAEPLAIDVAPDGTIGVYDAGRDVVLRWTPAGAPLPPLPTPPAFLGPGLALLDGGATLFTGLLGAQPAGGRPRHALLVYTEAGEAASLAAIPVPVERAVDFPSCGLSGVPVLPLFVQQFVWDAAGPIIAYNDRADYVVELLERGHHVRSIRRAIEPARGSAPLAMQEAGEGVRVSTPAPCVIPPAELVRGRGWANRVPIVLAVTIAPDGQLWVLRRAEVGMARIDVFDHTGAYLGTLPAASPFPVGFLADDRVVTIERTDDGVPYLAAYEVIR
jgi:hypothetical protein